MIADTIGTQSPVSAPRIGRVLLALVIVLTTLSVAAGGLRYVYGGDHYVEFARLFLVSGEANVPTWFTSVMLFSCAALLSSIVENRRRRGERRFLKHWWGLAIGFLYVSLDEVAQIHEIASEPLRDRLGTGGFFYHAWVVPALALLAVILVTYLPFLARLPPPTRLWLMLSGAVYVTGAVGMELVGGYVADYHPGEAVLRGIVKTLEEFLEMVGIVLLIYTLLTYRARVDSIRS